MSARTRMVITLNKNERQALGQLASRELRDPRDQIRLIVRQALEREHLLEVISQPNKGNNDSSKADSG